jgi:pimeloyl-ACP methyl ester carboxylesterase
LRVYFIRSAEKQSDPLLYEAHLDCIFMKKTTHVQPADLRAFAKLATQATAGITDLVEAMHATIARPFGMAHATIPERTNGITGFVYKAVRGTTKLVASSLDLALAQLKPELAHRTSSAERDAVIAALNGVLGDYLQATNNALEIPMSIHRDGEALVINKKTLARMPNVSGKLLILVHGLCMNDRQWLRNGHDHGAALASALDYTPLYVRYNSGLHTSINGQSLAALIESLARAWPRAIEEIVIVAHSMGGLVARSACEYGTDANHQWRTQLTKIVFLGTPHHGAPLERGGHWIDIILGAAPYAKPFARLGKIRSAGITDLRHGNVVDGDWQRADQPRQATPLPRDVACFAIAATTGKTERDWRDRLLGDGLVPVTSALGQSSESSLSLKFAKTRQWIGYEMNHMDLLDDERVFHKLKRWIAAA